MKQRLSDGAATALIALMLTLIGSLLRPADAPAASRTTEAAIIIVTATPTIGLPPVADIPVPTAVPQVEPPTPVPPLAVEPVQVQVQYVEVAPPTPAPAPTVVHIKLDGYVEMERPPHRPFDQPIYSANPIHDAPEPAGQP